MRIHFRVVAFIAVILLIAAWYGVRSSSTNLVGKSATQNLVNGSGVSPAKGRSGAGVLNLETGSAKNTYLPGYRRTLKAVPGPIELGKRTPGWWMLARTPSEAEWLDMHGYPTAAEEKGLALLTDDELSERAKKGDINAKTLLAVRTAKQSFAKAESINKLELEASVGQLGAALNSGGPYAASKVLETTAELVNIYYALPEKDRSAAKRNVLREYFVYREIALGLSIAYGDHTHNTLWGQAQSPLDDRMPSQKDVDGRSIAYALARSSEARIRLGIGPVSLMPRPLPESVEKRGFTAYGEMPTAFERE